ncbi:MAG: hypothetical protein ACI9ZX_002333, partial [Algoriphagus sp.]
GQTITGLSFFWLGPKEPKSQDMEMLLPACHRRPASMSSHSLKDDTLKKPSMIDFPLQR